jgi:predicted amidophosphoribosyltransferase
LILDRAALEAGERWSIRSAQTGQPPLIVKTKETPSLIGMNLARRRATAETEIRESLEIGDTSLIAGRRFLVFDDVFTDGCTLREVARALIGAGAAHVGGLVLARQPWR